MKVDGIDHVAISVRDVRRSIAWYQDVLDMERRHLEWEETPAMVCCGDTCVALFQTGAADPQPLDERETIAVRHIAFRAARSDWHRAQEELRRHGIAFEVEDHGIAHSIYFDDPDGHHLEITTYELDD